MAPTQISSTSNSLPIDWSRCLEIINYCFRYFELIVQVSISVLLQIILVAFGLLRDYKLPLRITIVYFLHLVLVKKLSFGCDSWTWLCV